MEQRENGDKNVSQYFECFTRVKLYEWSYKACLSSEWLQRDDFDLKNTMKAEKRDSRRCTFHWIPAWAWESAGGALKSVIMKVLFPIEVLLVVLAAMLISQGIFPSRGGGDHRDVGSGSRSSRRKLQVSH